MRGPPLCQPLGTLQEERVLQMMFLTKNPLERVPRQHPLTVYRYLGYSPSFFEFDT